MGQLITKFKKESQSSENEANQRCFNGATTDENIISSITPSQSTQRKLCFFQTSDDKATPEEVVCCGS